MSFSQQQLAPLKFFVELCQNNPQVLWLNDLKFVREFIEFFGGKVPPATDGPAKPKEPTVEQASDDETEDNKVESESEESNIELDMSGVIEPDDEPLQKMGNLSLQPTEEEIAEAQSKRSEAVSAFAEKDFDKALALYTEAITLNPHAALLYAKRGQVFLELKKPNACIRDCDRAIELNPDSAAAHKFRGRAHQLLGNWEKAANDLRFACKLDFDQQADEWLREVTPNARKIEEHKRKKERSALEKEAEARQEALKKAREAAKAREANSRPSQTDSSDKPGTSDFYQYLNDPEVQAAFMDPEVSAAFVDISSNPANILKYQSNPKIMNLIGKVATKFGGGNFGNMADMAGMFGGAGAGPKPSAPKPDDDVEGLD